MDFKKVNMNRYVKVKYYSNLKMFTIYFKIIKTHTMFSAFNLIINYYTHIILQLTKKNDFDVYSYKFSILYVYENEITQHMWVTFQIK